MDQSDRFGRGVWEYRAGTGGAKGEFLYRRSISVPFTILREAVLEVAVLEELVLSNFTTDDVDDDLRRTMLLDKNNGVISGEPLDENIIQGLHREVHGENKYVISNNHVFYIGYIDKLFIYYVKAVELTNGTQRYGSLFSQGLISILQDHYADAVMLYSADCAYSGMEIVRESHPDVTLVDINMPAVDGLTMIRSLQEEGQHSHFIILTGYDDFSHAVQALRLRVFDYLLKPVDQDMFFR